mgnify:CR=1 FL=1
MIYKILIVFILINIPSIAHAYIDPASGGFIIQGIIAFMAALIFYLKNPLLLLRKIKDFFSKNKKKSNETKNN